MRKYLSGNAFRIALFLFTVCLSAAVFLRYSDTAASQRTVASEGSAAENAGPQTRKPVQKSAFGVAESPPARDLPVWEPELLGLNEIGLTRKQLRHRRDFPFEVAINKTNRKIIRKSNPKAGAGAVDLFTDQALPETERQNAPTAAMPAPTLTFDSPNTGGGVLPPDTTGDVGLTQYVQQTNAIGVTPFTVFDKLTGAVVAGPTAMESLWPAGDPCGSGGSTAGDPVTLYDPLADRWLLSQFTADATPLYQCIAISRTNDAAGSYFVYTFQVPNTNFQDYPHYGVWPDGYYMVANQFADGGNGNFNGAGFFAFDRIKMLAGDPSATYIYFNKDDGCQSSACQFGGFLPTDFDGVTAPPVGMPNLFLTFNADEFGETDRIDGFFFTPDFVTPANSTLTRTSNIPLAPFDGRSPNSRLAIEQMGGSNLDSVGDRLMHRLAYRNLGTQSSPTNSFVGLFTVNVSGVNPTNAATYQAAPRWFELRGTNTLVGENGISVFDQGTHAPDPGNGATGLNRWMSSISQDHQGRIAVGYSSASTTQRADIVWAGRDTGAATGTLNATEVTFYAAAGSQTSSSGRWGDYSTITTDPADDCTFYYTQQVYNATSTSIWDTRIGYGKFPACANIIKATVGGTVTSCSTGSPIAGATISATGGFSRLTTTPGTFSIISAPGTYNISATAPGFSTALQNSVVVTGGSNSPVTLCLNPVAVLASGAATLVSESCLPANGAIDPGETVTVSLGVANIGAASTANDVGTLQPTGGVTDPSGPQNYGVLIAGGAAVSRNFTFTASSELACGAILTATVAHTDGSGNLGSFVYRFPTGALTTVLSENFDEVTPPALPPLWTAANAVGPAPLWVTATGANHTPPNVVFADSPPVVSDKRLDTPAFTPTAGSQVTFRHSWNLEAGFDGGVLEISVGGAAFQDILLAGGSFVAGGYTGPIASNSGSPIGGRAAWTGSSPGFVATTVNLPATAAGQSVVLRFRLTADESVPSTGWRVDTFSVTSRICCIGGGPTPTPTPGPSCTPAQLIRDGGFETNTGSPVSNSNWTSTGTALGTSLCTTGACGTGQGAAPPRTGSGWVWFDGVGTGSVAENGTVQQTVTIPNGTATLSYYLRIGAVTVPSSSVLTVRVDGNIVQTINEPAEAESAYTERTVDISAFANGAPHVIQFNYARPAGTTGSDNFTIDDVSLQFACPLATISGKITLSDGRGLRNATVTLVDPFGPPRSVNTSSFGFYSFAGVRVGDTYTIRVKSTRFRFATRTVLFTREMSNLDFLAQE